MRIFKKIFKENKNYDFSTKCYLYLDYKQSLKQIKKNEKLSTIDFILFMKLDPEFNSKNKIMENKSINFMNIRNNNNFPDFEKELNDIKDELQIKRIKKIKIYFNKYLQMINIKYLIDLKNSQNNVKQIFAFISRHIGTYNQSMQELVEGQREVTQNKNYLFDDGETVQEKKDKFENKIKDYMNIEAHINNLKNNHR